MKKVLSLVALAMISTIMFAVNDGVKADQNKKEAKSGEVIVMNKEMFINDVFDYQNSKEWKYKGDKPAIIDLYADWFEASAMPSSETSVTRPVCPILRLSSGRSSALNDTSDVTTRVLPSWAL